MNMPQVAIARKAGPAYVCYMAKETLGARVRRLRTALGMSQDGLSKAANVSATHVYQVESGRRSRLHEATAKLYADALIDAMPEDGKRDAVNYLLFGYVPPAIPDRNKLPDIDVYLRARGALLESDIVNFATLIATVEEMRRLGGD